ncbi:MAG: murF [Bacteroidetes bacterium]|nr:murF [Bacteroidota bacterium]
MISEIYSQFLNYPVISTDTRKIIPYSIFFCLKGEQFDGNLFVNQALELGAKFVVTENSSFTDHPQCFVVKNVLETLQILATNHRLELKIPVIGITGTNGKTTTKELITKVLSQKYNVQSTVGNLNNHIGVPLTILSITKEHEIAVVEMGANHVNEISELCTFAYPTHGVVTNIGNAHLEGFKSYENIVETKMGLYDAVIHDSGVLFVNGKDLLLVKEAKTRIETSFKKTGHNNTQIQFYGVDQDPFINGSVTAIDPYLTIQIFDQQIKTQITGAYNLDNILCAASIGRFFGVSDAQIIEAIQSYAPNNQRSQVKMLGNNTIIADYYNANPTSMKAAIENFMMINASEKVAVLGDMFELGDFSSDEHEKIVNLCNEFHLETYFIGTHFSHLKNDTTHFFESVDKFKSVFEILTLTMRHPKWISRNDHQKA